MKKKSVLPKASLPSTDETRVPEQATTPKRPASTVKKTSAKVPPPIKSRTRTAALKIQTPSDSSAVSEAAPEPGATPVTAKSLTAKAQKSARKTAGETTAQTPLSVAAKKSTRSPARSPTASKTRKPARLKTSPVSPTPEPTLNTEPAATEDVLIQQASGTTQPQNTLAETTAAEKTGPATVTPPVVNDAELWEQASPVKLRIAQLRTRNSILDEQLQRLRPPFQARGKKK
jgi:hypothetical protein